MPDDPSTLVGGDDLETRLAAALHSGLGSAGVEVGAVITGSRRRARTIRARRATLAAGSAVLVVGLPVAYEAVGPKPAGTDSTAMLARPATTSAAELRAARRWIPDSAGLTPAEIPAGLQVAARGAGPRAASAGGLDCAGPGTQPAATRSFTYAPGGRTGKGSAVITLIVTRWPGDQASAAMAGIAAGTGDCGRLQRAHGEQVRPGNAGHRTTTWIEAGQGHARVVMRIGDLVSSLEARSPQGTTAALELATRLAGLRTPGLTRIALLPVPTSP